MAAGEETLFKVAVTATPPNETPVATPVALIVATALLLDAHVTWLVMFAVVLSEYLAVAVKVVVHPCAIDAVPGVMEMLASFAGAGVPPLSPPPPQAARNPTRIAAINGRTDAIMLSRARGTHCGDLPILPLPSLSSWIPILCSSRQDAHFFAAQPMPSAAKNNKGDVVDLI